LACMLHTSSSVHACLPKRCCAELMLI
jgi:hypothetical protein